MRNSGWRGLMRHGLVAALLAMALAAAAWAQGVSTTTVQGTVYLANGQPGSGTVSISWPAFTTAAGQAVVADTTTVTIAADGFVSLNLAPNLGSTPAGEYYTAVFYMSDGTVNTQYWVVPAAPQATLAQVQAQVMPAAQAVQTVSKAYVDQAITELSQTLLAATGGTLDGPLYLNGDPTQPMQAATKHYVDTQVATALPLTGGTVTGAFTARQIGGAYQADQFPGADFGAEVQACVNALNANYGGTCDARNFTGNLAMASNLTITTPNTAILLPCATITTANQIVVTAGTRNVSLRGCALRGGSAASGSEGGTVIAYSGAGVLVQVGDATYAVDTPGFHMDNVALNITASTSAAAEGLIAYRTQELDLESVYFLGNPNQTGMTLDGTGNYTGGTFMDNQLSGFATAVNAIGHQTANAATTDWMNASTFLRLHIDCPTSSGNPVSGTTGINLQQGDGNTILGGDVEGCATALHLGANAQNNTIVGLRNENSTSQVVADTGSRYNSWMSGGTMYTGAVTDNGTRNSFLDTFHRSFNGWNGDWYGSQRDATVTNHVRLGTGAGNERGMLNEIQTDYGYRWEDGYSDGSSGEQFWTLTDMINNLQRISVGQYLSGAANVVTNVVMNNGGCYSSSTPPTVTFTGGGGVGAAATANMYAITNGSSCAGGYGVASVTMTSNGSGYTSQPAVMWSGSNQTSTPNGVAEITPAGGTNDQTVMNSAGTGAVVLNGSNGSGTGGVVIGSGGATETTVATVDQAGNAQFSGSVHAGGTMQSAGTLTVRNSADAEVDYYLWPGKTASQKGAFTYKDWNGNSQWYMVKDGSNNWSLNSAVGGLDSFKAYQSTNSGDTYVDASNATGHIRMNYESGSGAETDIYSGSSASLVAAFLGPTAIKFPGLAASSGHFCLQVDSSGYITNTGSACGTGSGSGGGSGTVNTGSAGQIAYYAANGTAVSGENTVPLTAGGTGATSASGALANLLPGVTPDGNNGAIVTGNVTTASAITANSPVCDIRAYGAKIDNVTDIGPAIQACLNQSYPGTYVASNSYTVLLPCGDVACYWDNPSKLTVPTGSGYRMILQGYLRLGSTLVNDPRLNWYGAPPGEGVQFQPGTPGLISGPVVYGTLGTAVSTEDAAVTITPTFTSGDIAHLPAGAAITIGETKTASATAARVVGPSGYGVVTLTLSSYARYLPMEVLTVSGCSDTSFNITGGAILKVDYSAAGGEQVTYSQTTATAGTATGCTVTSFDEDRFESARVLCSNGVNMAGASYSCGAGQITLITNHPHAASAQWGAVAVAPTDNSQMGHTFSDMDINSCVGMCYWGENESNLQMTNVGTSPAGGFLTAGSVEQTGTWVGWMNQVHFWGASLTLSTPLCGGGGCTQSAYPYGLRCDSGTPAAGYGEGATGCAAYSIDGGAIDGGIKIDGGGRRQITAFPFEIKNILFEQAPDTVVSVDNRFGIDSTTCLNLHNDAAQDNLTGMMTYYLSYTDNEAPSNGCYKLSNLATALTPYLTNPYFNDALSVDSISYGTAYAPASNTTTTTGVYNDGVELQAPVRGSGAGFGPQVLPFGSLPIDNNASDWASLCKASDASCTAVTTNVSCPDGTQATSKMGCAELDGPGGAFNIGTWTGSTYAGDQFIYGCYVRPGANFSFPQGLQAQDAFMLYTHGADGFAGNPYTTIYTYPSFGFGTKMAHDTWYPEIAIALITTGDGAAHTINFMIGPGNGNSGSAGAGYGNQFSNCRWAFVPGPNNPAYAGATADEVAYARDNQYRGAVPSNMNAGVAATGETISTGGYQLNGVALNAPSETYNAAASGSIALPTADRAEATYVLSGNATATIGTGAGGSRVTVLVCQPASGGPFTWTWPASWRGGVTVGATANTCSEQTGTYISGLGDWHGDAGTANVPQ